MIATLRPRRLRPDVPLQDGDGVRQRSDKGPNGRKEVIERSVAHEDDVFLWSGCGGVVRIPLIFWKETEETNVQVL